MTYTICSELLCVRIATLGAEVQAIESAEGRSFMWSGDPAYWGEYAPLLFPVVGRLYEGGYTYQGTRYPMQIHGFLRFQVFSVVAHLPDTLILRATHSEETLAVYPFAFSYTVTYRVTSETLIVETVVENTGSKRLYYSHGSHHGFAVPLESSLAFSDYQIVFPQAEDVVRCIFSENLLDTEEVAPYQLKEGKVLPLEHGIFDDDAVVLAGTGSMAILQSNLDSAQVRIEYPEAPYFSLWHTPKTDAPFVCMEALHSLPAVEGEVLDLETKEDLYILEEGERRTDVLRITCTE